MVGKIEHEGITYDDYVSELPEISKNERRALLATANEFGAEGQARFAREAQAAADARANSMEVAAARGAAIHEDRALEASLESGYDSYFDKDITSGAQQTLSHGREMDRIGAAADAYIRGVGAAANLYGPGGGGGRGGGGRGGGGGGYGGGGGDYAATSEGPQMDLATAGELAGLALPSELAPGAQTTGTRMLFGEADLEGPGGFLLDKEGEVVMRADPKTGKLYPVSAVGGDVDLKNIFFALQDMQASGADPESLKQVMLDELIAGDFTPSQVEAAAATLDNYFGITGGVVQVGDYNVFGLDDETLATVAAHAGGASAEGFANDAASELTRFERMAERTKTDDMASARSEALSLIGAEFQAEDQQMEESFEDPRRAAAARRDGTSLTQPSARDRIMAEYGFGILDGASYDELSDEQQGEFNMNLEEEAKRKAEQALYGSDEHWDRVAKSKNLSKEEVAKLKRERANRVTRAVNDSAAMAAQKAFT